MSVPQLAYYGDDFTGSADVMEVLQWAGYRTVLFLEPPTSRQLATFDGLFAFGVAGCSRTMSPAAMETDLRDSFVRMTASGAAIIHYKICSTFDSSPEIGSIGKAIEIGRDVMGHSVVPVVAAAPNLGRYQVFGNLFARSGLDTEPFRLDRHPTMQHHPITPMDESDLRLHLARQTRLSVGLLDLLQLTELSQIELLAAVEQVREEILLFDLVTHDQHAPVGAAIQYLAAKASPKFVVGSSGVEYALTAHWANDATSSAGQRHTPNRPQFSPTDQLLVVTGSCSPVNARQIEWAERHGFESIALNTAQLVDPATREREIAAVIGKTLARLGDHAQLILHTSLGPMDPRIAETANTFRRIGYDEIDIRKRSGQVIGTALGQIVAGVLARHRLKRIGIAGGDTSGYVARELGVVALEAIAPVAPGSPLCVAHASTAMDKVEVIFKGGQVGRDNVWETILRGSISKSH